MISIIILGWIMKKRILDLFDSIKNHGYPYLDQYIILFNGENIVRDGQHESSSISSFIWC